LQRKIKKKRKSKRKWKRRRKGKISGVGMEKKMLRRN
jgi:hypothetical protein